MRAMQTAVQYPERRDVDTLFDPLGDQDDIPLDNEVGVVAITLHVPVDDAEWLERLASHRNMLADVQKRKLKTRHSRKSVAENLLNAATLDARKKLAAQILACGPLPPKAEKDDKGKANKKQLDAETDYANKVLAWAKNRG